MQVLSRFDRSVTVFRIVYGHLFKAWPRVFYEHTLISLLLPLLLLLAQIEKLLAKRTQNTTNSGELAWPKWMYVATSK